MSKEENKFKAVVGDSEYAACPKCSQVTKKNPNCESHRGPKNSWSLNISGANYNQFIGKKVGDVIDGIFVGEGDKTLSGCKVEITGGSDASGVPIRPEVAGGNLKRILVTAGVGFKGKLTTIKKNDGVHSYYRIKGMRKRLPFRGNVITPDIVQLNLKVVDKGNKSLADLLGDSPSQES